MDVHRSDAQVELELREANQRLIDLLKQRQRLQNMNVQSRPDKSTTSSTTPKPVLSTTAPIVDNNKYRNEENGLQSSYQSSKSSQNARQKLAKRTNEQVETYKTPRDSSADKYSSYKSVREMSSVGSRPSARKSIPQGLETDELQQQPIYHRRETEREERYTETSENGFNENIQTESSIQERYAEYESYDTDLESNIERLKNMLQEERSQISKASTPSRTPTRTPKCTPPTSPHTVVKQRQLIDRNIQVRSRFDHSPINLATPKNRGVAGLNYSYSDVDDQDLEQRLNENLDTGLNGSITEELERLSVPKNTPDISNEEEMEIESGTVEECKRAESPAGRARSPVRKARADLQRATSPARRAKSPVQSSKPPVHRSKPPVHRSKSPVHGSKPPAQRVPVQRVPVQRVPRPKSPYERSRYRSRSPTISSKNKARGKPTRGKSPNDKTKKKPSSSQKTKAPTKGALSNNTREQQKNQLVDAEVLITENRLKDAGNDRKNAAIVRDLAQRPKAVLFDLEAPEQDDASVHSVTMNSQSINNTTQGSKNQSLNSSKGSSKAVWAQGKDKRALLGYDWIAGLLDNDESVTEKPDDYYKDLLQFRKENKSDCVGREPMRLNGTMPSAIHPVIEDPTHSCIHGYTISERLFTQAMNIDEAGRSVCPICLVDRRKPTQVDPGFVRVSIPRSTLASPYRIVPHRRRSFDPSDSYALSNHCLQGWQQAKPSTIPTASTVDLKQGIKEKQILSYEEVQKLMKTSSKLGRLMTSDPITRSSTRSLDPTTRSLDLTSRSLDQNSDLDFSEESRVSKATKDLFNKSHSMRAGFQFLERHAALNDIA